MFALKSVAKISNKKTQSVWLHVSNFIKALKPAKTLSPIFVLALALLFSFWFLPTQYINPASVGWIFTTNLENLADGAGHAIQGMFFGEEPFHWPPGKIVNFGGPVGASIIMAAVSPLLAFPAKLLEITDLIGPFWQFIGIQALLGICFTALSVYYLCLALGASVIASATVALLCLPLPNLFVPAIFNESLSWQFLAIIPMILLLEDRNSLQKLWRWPATMGIAVWSNTYFAAMIMVFFLVHLCVSRRLYQTPYISLAKELLTLLFFASFLHYVGGGFTVSLQDAGSSISFIDAYSVVLQDFFHLEYNRQGYIYRGHTVLVLLICWGTLMLTKKTISSKIESNKDREYICKNSHDKLIMIVTAITTAALFIISLGPILHFSSSWSIKSPLPESLYNIVGIFRAVGRFSWPAIYFLLGLTALAIDELILVAPIHKNKRPHIKVIFCLILVSLQFGEFYPQLEHFKNYAHSQARKKNLVDSNLDNAVSVSDEIEFLPAFDQDNLGTDKGAPWNSISYYAIKYHVPIYDYQWLGRYDHAEIKRIRNLGITMAEHCQWTKDHLYVIERSYMDEIAHCNYQIDELKSYPNWIILKLKR